MKKLLIILPLLICSITSLAQEAELKPLDRNLENYQYPFPVQYLSLQVQGQQLKMAFMDVKPTVTPNGKVVVLLHGKNFNGAYWQQTAESLAEEGYRVIIPDQIGFGKSDKPEMLQYSFQLLAQNTKAVLDTLGIEKVAILGHSMGGMLATRFALMYPEISEKLVLVNPIGLEDWKRKVPYQPVEAWYAHELQQNEEKIKKYQQENYYGDEWKPAYAKWANVLAGWTLNEEDYPQIAWNAALTYDMIMTQPVLYEFGDLRMPTLLIIGQRDKTALGKNLVSDEVRNSMGNYPLLGRQTAQRIDDAELVILNGVGHLPHIEAFERFILPLQQFLRKGNYAGK